MGTTNDIKGYRQIHLWVERQLGKPLSCTRCLHTFQRTRQVNWANISGEYKRELTDWVRLCVGCHRRMDNSKRCRNGHIRSDENTRIQPNGWRRCKICYSRSARKSYLNRHEYYKDRAKQYRLKAKGAVK